MMIDIGLWLIVLFMVCVLFIGSLMCLVMLLYDMSLLNGIVSSFCYMCC